MRSSRLPVLTLVAVFVSLGLGLLMGAAISGSDEIRLRQQAVLTNLESEVVRVRSVQDELSLRLHAETAARQAAENVNQTLLEWAVADRLQGGQVAIFYASPGAVGAARSLRRLLQLSGSQIVYEYRLDALAGSASNVTQLLAGISAAVSMERERSEKPPAFPNQAPEQPQTSPQPSEQPSTSTAVDEDAGGSLIVLVLVKAGDRPRNPAPQSVDAAAEQAANERTFLNFHRELLRQARQQGIERIALGVFRDGTEVSESLIQTYARQQALVVDGVDKSGGQAALVLGLSVDARGVLGIFPDAVLIPAYPRAIPAGSEAGYEGELRDEETGGAF
jgi:hypothetical protein